MDIREPYRCVVDILLRSLDRSLHQPAEPNCPCHRSCLVARCVRKAKRAMRGNQRDWMIRYQHRLRRRDRLEITSMVLPSVSCVIRWFHSVPDASANRSSFSVSKLFIDGRAKVLRNFRCKCFNARWILAIVSSDRTANVSSIFAFSIELRHEFYEQANQWSVAQGSSVSTNPKSPLGPSLQVHLCARRHMLTKLSS